RRATVAPQSRSTPRRLLVSAPPTSSTPSLVDVVVVLWASAVGAAAAAAAAAVFVGLLFNVLPCSKLTSHQWRMIIWSFLANVHTELPIRLPHTSTESLDRIAFIRQLESGIKPQSDDPTYLRNERRRPMIWSMATLGSQFGFSIDPLRVRVRASLRFSKVVSLLLTHPLGTHTLSKGDTQADL
ncbi:hypothetical protein ACTXT7_009516, partial [Hymenolepis weldensis]